MEEIKEKKKISKKYYFIGIIFIALCLAMFVPSYRITIEKVGNSFLSFVSSDTIDQNWTIENDLVYFEDTRAYLSAEPHTLSSSQWVYFNLTSKIFEGEIDAVWGFDSDSAKPTRAELYKPHWINWTTDHSQTFLNVSAYPTTEEPCDYGNSYNPIKVKITYQICGEWNWTEEGNDCLYYNTTSSVVCYDSLDASDTPNYTAYWKTEHARLENWVDISDKFNSIDYDYQGMSKWYYLKNVSINANQNYQVRTWVDMPISLNGVSGKYFWAVKPTSKTIQEAIDTDTFYALDPWFNSSWTYKKDITIDYTKVNGSQVNFPVLINTTDADLITKAQADGDDIVFTDSDGDKLDHEIEYFNSTTGWLVAWVKIPTLSNTTNTTIQMYYGNAGATNQQNASGVWDDNFVMVQHLSETPGGTNITYDSTSYGNNGTATNMYSDDQVTGQIDGSLDFDGGDDYVDLPDDIVPVADLPNGITYSGWCKVDVLGETQAIVGQKSGVAHSFYSSGGIFIYNNNYPRMFIFKNGAYQWAIGDTALDTGVFYHITGTYEPLDDKLRIYVDGILKGISDVLGGSFLAGTNAWNYIGMTTPGGGNYDYEFEGLIDEVHISNVARSAGWIATEYNNQFSPDSFYSVGGEETGDETYPQFSNYADNNNTLTDSGTGLFNVTIENTNGTALLEINGENITASNISNLFNASYEFSSGGTYTYRWHSWGNGSSANYNVSVDRDYFVNSSAVDSCTYTSGNWVVDCSDNCEITDNVDVGGNNISITGTGTFIINGANVSNYDTLYLAGTDTNNICEVFCYGGCFA